MCVENYSYSNIQDQHKQTIKYNKSINHNNNYFLLYKKVLFTHLILKKIKPNQNILKTKKILYRQKI